MRPILGLEFLLTSLLFVPLLIFNDKNTSASTVEEDSGNFMMVETPEHDRIPDLLLVEKPDGKTSLIQIDADKGNDTIIDRSIAQDPEICTKCIQEKKYKEYFQIQCTDFDKYFKCQSKCVSSKSNGVKTPFECVRSPACAKKCESSCKKVWPASITYDAYCGMMDYVRMSPIWNPYDNEDTIKRWIAMFYMARKEKGLIGKDCTKPLVNSHASARIPTDPRQQEPGHFAGFYFDLYDDDVPIWDITTKELEEAYKTVAMTRQIPWTSNLSYEKPKYKCIPWFFRKEVAAGDFPRRNTWLLLEDGCMHRAYLFAKHLTEYVIEKFPQKTFEPPHKHFIFGNLHVDSKNARKGVGIDWNHHVAPTVRISNPNPDTLWILDPALNAKPVSKADYHQKFNENGNIYGYVTCGSNTYSTGDLCLNAIDNDDPKKWVHDLFMSYFEGEMLNSEWLLQREKDRKVEQVLGDKWKKNNYYVFK